MCLGLGLLSKYTIGFSALSTVHFHAVRFEVAPLVSVLEPYAAALFALAVFSPVIYLELLRTIGLPSRFKHRAAWRNARRFALHKLIAGALVLLTPTGLASAALLLLRRTHAADLSSVSVEGHDASGRRGAPPIEREVHDASVDEARKWRFLQVDVGVPLEVFAVFSLRHEVKLDWTGAPWVAAVPALAFGIVHSGQSVLAGCAPGSEQPGHRLWPLLLVSTGPDSILGLGIPGSVTANIGVGSRGLERIRDPISQSRMTPGRPAAEPLDRRHGSLCDRERTGVLCSRSRQIGERDIERASIRAGRTHVREVVSARRQRGRTLLLVAWDPVISPRESHTVERRAAGSHRRGPHHARQPGHPALLLLPR